MALFRNLRVNLRDSLFPPSGRDAQSLDFLDLEENCSFLNWKLKLVPAIADFNFRMSTSLMKMSLLAVGVSFQKRTASRKIGFIRQMNVHLFKNSFIRGFWKTTPEGFLRFQGSRFGHFKALRTGEASPLHCSPSPSRLCRNPSFAFFCHFERSEKS
jgi:hypothetical protein